VAESERGAQAYFDAAYAARECLVISL